MNGSVRRCSKMNCPTHPAERCHHNALALPDAQVAAWEKQWGSAKPETFDLAGGAGKTWTQAAQSAAADGTRLLTQDDPPPQTVYRVAVKPGAPLAVQVRLLYKLR